MVCTICGSVHLKGMPIEDLIQALQNILRSHGNLHVYREEGHFGLRDIQ